MTNPEKDYIKKDIVLTEYCRQLKKKYTANKKILLIQLPQFLLDCFNPEVAKKRGYYAFPPTGLQYLYESLKPRGLDIRILDLNYECLKYISNDDTFKPTGWLNIFKDYFESFEPFIIGASCMYDSGINSLIQLLEFIRDDNRSVVITGGIIATYEAKGLIERDLCHFAIKGECENKINYLFDYLMDESYNFKPVPGICYKSADVYRETESEPDQVKLEADMIESYAQVNIEDYHRYGSLNPFSRLADISNLPYAAIQMSRGCRAVCTFCSVRDFMGKGVRARPVDKVLAEMEFLIKKRGVRHFEWLDDDLLFYKENFKSLLKEIIKRGWHISWSANNGLIATSIDNETMSLMRDSGCIGFKIGIETGNPQMLKKIKKPITFDSVRKVSLIVNRYPEIFVGGNFMLGFPGETFSEMMDSLKFYLELNLDWGAFTICQAIRGATAFSEFQDYFDSQMESNGANVRNFIPTRQSFNGKLSIEGDVATGLDIFRIDPDSVPSQEQVKEIWFTFNLIGNFINNKNLKPTGRIEKFIAWVEMAQLAYPTNPYMSLFLSLAYLIKGDSDKCEEKYKEAVLCSKTDYWRERFSAFRLDELLNNFPESKTEVFERIRDLQKLTALPLLCTSTKLYI